MPDKPVNVKVYERRAAGQHYVHRVLGQFDVFINTVTGGAADDTISSRMQRWKIGDVPNSNSAKKAFGKFMCWWLGKIQHEHDVKANAGDLERAEAEEKRTDKTLKDSGSIPPGEVE